MIAMTSNGDFDQAKAAAFGAKVLDFKNGASATLCLSVGHQTGLFDAIAGREPSTSRWIADAAGLHERHVRGWLNALVVSGVAGYDRAAQAYSPPAEHAAALTCAAGPHNAAAMTTL